MKSRSPGFWQALESVPGFAAVRSEWQFLLGNDYRRAKSFFRPSGRLASSYPCPVDNGCGFHHNVVSHGGDDIVVVCPCGRGEEILPLSRSDIVIYELDRSSLDAALANVFDLMEELDAETGLHGTTLIGVYSPFAGYRFPVYLTIQIESVDFNIILDGLLARNNTPFLLFAPTRELCTTKAEKRLADHRSSFIPLMESVGFGGDRKFQLLHPFDDILAQFRGLNLPSLKEDGSMAFFPTPPDATWSDVSVKFMNSHTVSIRVISAGGIFHYAQLGMANKKNSNPTKQWELFEAFAEGHGTMDWSSGKADRRNQKRRELFAADLRQFFRIDGDPFRLSDDGKGWLARFFISPE